VLAAPRFNEMGSSLFRTKSSCPALCDAGNHAWSPRTCSKSSTLWNIQRASPKSLWWSTSAPHGFGHLSERHSAVELRRAGITSGPSLVTGLCTLERTCRHFGFVATTRRFRQSGLLAWMPRPIRVTKVEESAGAEHESAPQPSGEWTRSIRSDEFATCPHGRQMVVCVRYGRTSGSKLLLSSGLPA
jgi:hypothetical protein